MATVNELADLYAGKTNPALYTTIRDSFNQQQLQQELLNRQKQQTIDQGAQSFPLEQAIRQGTIDTTAARLPGITAESNKLQREDAFDASQFFNKLDEAQRSHLLKASQHDLDMMDATAAKMMQDPNPEVQKQGQALYSMSRGVQKAQMEWGIRERIAADRNASQERIAAQKSALLARLAGERNNLLSASKAGKPDKLSMQNLYAKYKNMAVSAENDSERNYYDTLAQQVLDDIAEIEQAKAGARREGTPDLNKLGVQTVPTPVRKTPKTTPTKPTALDILNEGKGDAAPTTSADPYAGFKMK